MTLTARLQVLIKGPSSPCPAVTQMEGDSQEMGKEAGTLGKWRGFCLSTGGPSFLGDREPQVACSFILLLPLGASTEAFVESSGGLGLRFRDSRSNHDYHWLLIVNDAQLLAIGY